MTRVNGSSGWATLQKQFLIPYRLDSGADHSVISEETVTTLHKEAFLKLRTLDEPVEVELGDGTIKRIKQLVSMDTELEKPADSVILRRVEFRILPGAST